MVVGSSLIDSCNKPLLEMSIQKPRILIVDDLADNLFLLQTVLETEGYQVESALSGAIALDQIESSPPDLVLLDIMMPGLNGYEVAQRIRQEEQLSEMPIVFMTAHDEFSNLRYSEVGVNGLIRKPINFDELLAKVADFMSSAEQSRPQAVSTLRPSPMSYEVSYSWGRA